MGFFQREPRPGCQLRQKPFSSRQSASTQSSAGGRLRSLECSSSSPCPCRPSQSEAAHRSTLWHSKPPNRSACRRPPDAAKSKARHTRCDFYPTLRQPASRAPPQVHEAHLFSCKSRERFHLLLLFSARTTQLCETILLKTFGTKTVSGSNLTVHTWSRHLPSATTCFHASMKT